MKLIRALCIMLYYFWGRHLPASGSPYALGAKKIRYWICKGIFPSMGKSVNIEHGAFFGRGKDIHIGDYSGLGICCRVSGPINIGNYVMMGPDVMIYTANHSTESTSIPMVMQGETSRKAVTIEDDVWIGARAIILPGVTIHRGSVIGAGAVVTKDVPPFAVVGGNPARIIKYRDKGQLCK